MVAAAFDLVDVHIGSSSVLNDELGDRAALVVVAVAWGELVDLDGRWFEDLVGVEAGGDDDADRDTIVGVASQERNWGGSACGREDGGEDC